LPINLQKYIGQGMALNTNDDMSKLAVLKNLIVELAELEQSFKKTDINQFKSFFGVTKDTINIKYVAEPVTFERTTSFIGTINDDTFLKDRSGSTRFLVLLVNKLNGFHKIDMLQLYKEIFETTDYCNFELNEVERESQREINEEFEQPNLLEETFLDNFELDFKEGGEYMNCSEMLKQLSLGVKDFTYSRKADIKHIVDKYKFKYRKDLKKWLVKIKQSDN
jgi:predicted P-loop ATPase